MAAIVTVINEGDSLTAGAGVGFRSYVWQYAGYTSAGIPPPDDVTLQRFWQYRKASSFVGINYAVPGSKLLGGSSLDVRAAAVDALVAVNKSGPLASSTPPVGHESTTRAARKYILTVLIGTNDGDADPGDGTVYAGNVATYLDARYAAGFDRIVLGTLLSNGGGSATKAQFNSFRDEVNAVFRDSGWKSTHHVSALMDFAADATIGGNDVCDNTTYYNVDKIHPNETCHAIMATIYGTALEAVIATL